MNYRLVFMDNFYSRHTFATHLKKFSDNDIKVIGTVRCNMVDSANRDNVLKGLERVNDKPMHSWVLVRAHDKVESTSNKRRKVQSNTLDNYLNVSPSKQPSSVHPKAGYIIWKDKKSIPFTQMTWKPLQRRIFWMEGGQWTCTSQKVDWHRELAEDICKCPCPSSCIQYVYGFSGRYGSEKGSHL